MPPKMLAWKHYIHEEVQCTFHVSGAALGVSLKQRGNPHLKPATKPKHAKPNHAGA
jgi:hypothetical protein